MWSWMRSHWVGQSLTLFLVAFILDISPALAESRVGTPNRGRPQSFNRRFQDINSGLGQSLFGRPDTGFSNLVKTGDNFNVSGNGRVNNLFERGRDLEEREIRLTRNINGRFTIQCFSQFRSRSVTRAQGVCENETVQQFSEFLAQNIEKTNAPGLIARINADASGVRGAFTGQFNIDFGSLRGIELEKAVGAFNQMINEATVFGCNTFSKSAREVRIVGGRAVLSVNLANQGLSQTGLALLASSDPASKCLGGTIRFNAALKLQEPQNYYASLRMKAGDNESTAFGIDGDRLRAKCMIPDKSGVATNDKNREVCFPRARTFTLKSNDRFLLNNKPVDIFSQNVRTPIHGGEILQPYCNGAVRAGASDGNGKLVTEVPQNLVQTKIFASAASCGRCHQADEYFQAGKGNGANRRGSIAPNTKFRLPNIRTFTGQTVKDFYMDPPEYNNRVAFANAFIKAKRIQMRNFFPDATGRAESTLTKFFDRATNEQTAETMAESMGVSTQAFKAKFGDMKTTADAFNRNFCQMRSQLTSAPTTPNPPTPRSASGVAHE